MKLSGYKKKFKDKGHYVEGTHVIMVHDTFKDKDGDPAMKPFLKDQASTAMESGWKVAGRAKTPPEAKKKTAKAPVSVDEKDIVPTLDKMD